MRNETDLNLKLDDAGLLIAQSQHTNDTLVLMWTTTGIEASQIAPTISQIDTEMEELRRRMEELCRHKYQLEEVQRVRDRITRSKSFLILSNDLVEDNHDVWRFNFKKTQHNQSLSVRKHWCNNSQYMLPV